MVSRLGDALNRFARRFVPDPFVLAFGLTGVVAILGVGMMLARTDAGPSEIATALGSGWLEHFSNVNLLAFALQMCLVLVTGHALAMSRPVQAGVVALAKIPRSAAGATMLVAFVACLAALIHWGLGAIVGAFLAREIGRHAAERKLELHYPLLGAAAYAGMAVWHGGFSGSAPTLVAKSGALSLGDMLLSPLNLAVTGTLVIAIPLLLGALAPKRTADLIPPPPLDTHPPDDRTTGDKTTGDEGAGEGFASLPWLGIALGVAGLALVISLIAAGRAKLEINTINAIFFFGGLALVGRLDRYVVLVSDGARGAGAIIVQFPLYFGILGLMKASGMVRAISESMATIGSKTTLPIMDFASAGAVNLAIPSGGGQWVVQRDILLGAGDALGVDPVTTIMAFSYGDAWTNMLQPFWALPLLAIMGLKAKDIIGYTAMVFLLMAAVVPLWLVILG